MMADEFSVLSDPFWPWWIWNWRLKRALGRRLDRLNQSIYIQLGGCIFLVSFSISLVCMCVGGGWEVRAALMILKWQGPEFFRTCGRAAAVAAAAFFVFLFFSLSPLFHPLLSVFIYRFIALHSYTHTHTHTRISTSTQTSANPSIWLDGIPVPFPPVVFIFSSSSCSSSSLAVVIYF
jgi:hypothetical protein